MIPGRYNTDTCYEESGDIDGFYLGYGLGPALLDASLSAAGSAELAVGDRNGTIPGLGYDYSVKEYTLVFCKQ
ncbi:MAG: hypothetical protein JW852_08655 [Spirochaetales bacterium]|nr:hypothetical protein [Spirochaetales bacterium]